MIVIAAIALLFPGCQRPGEVVRQAEQGTREIIDRLDPTGVRLASGASEQAWDALRLKFEAVDVDNLNMAITDFQTAAAMFAARMDAVPAEDIQTLSVELTAAVAAIRAQLQRMHIDEALDALLMLIHRLENEINKIDLTQVNATLAATRDAAAGMQQDAEGIAKDVTAVLGDLRTQIGEAGERIGALPPEQLQEAVKDLREASTSLKEATQRLPQATARIDEVLGSARFALRVAAGACMVLGLAGIVWIVRGLRRARI